MGLTPCGMVWMALVPAAAIGHPLLSSLGMLCFGIGTVPALSSVVLLDRFLANRFSCSKISCADAESFTL